MHSVVVDDHDMGITHVIRGDDHLTNAFRQKQLYDALGWEVPAFAHIPLIHGPDGAKLSKRHGALGVDAYRDMGYLPEAMRNYLLRLGWSHGDDEIISTEQAIAWFDLDAVGRSPARFDFNKLNNLNGHYLRARADADLVAMIAPRLEQTIGAPIAETGRARLLRGMTGLKPRAKTLIELATAAAFYVLPRPLPLDDGARKLLEAPGRVLLGALLETLRQAEPWQAGSIEAMVRAVAEQRQAKLGALAQPLRAALTGSAASPPIFEVMEALGREESLGRIEDALAAA
jgi:glutamyl-tRNA synthetase